MEQRSKWPEPPRLLSLETDEVHVWRIELEQPGDLLRGFLATLETEEQERANRFRFEKHRRGFVVARGFLRTVLGRYLNANPEALRFSYGLYGKPALAGEHESSTLRFNMSHSQDLALLAVTSDRDIGVDVEYIRTDFASADIARHFFSRAEVEAFDALPETERVAAFFRCWTRKEAFIKATGRGLSHPLDAFDVSLDCPAALLRAAEDDPSRWTLVDIDVGEDYAAALAVQGHVSSLNLYSSV
jgi:4'-phosphopantetheinyl transferase